MQQISWTIFTVLVVGAVSVRQDRDDTVRDKRQSVPFSVRLGPNDETILVIDGDDIVFLTGNNARCFPIFLGEFVQYGSNGILVVTSFRVGPFLDIEEFRFLGETASTVEVTRLGSSAPFRSGPGVLYVSNCLAFFTNNAINVAINETKATARPLRTQVAVIQVMSAGQPVSLLNVNSGNFTMILTGSPTKRLGITTDNRILYTGSTVRVEQGVLQITEYPNIFIFAVLRVPPGSSDPQYNVLFTATTEVIQGPGQVYVSTSENKAFFVEDFTFRSGGRDVIESVNRQIFVQAFSFEDTGESVIVRDSLTNPVVTLSINTSKFDLFDAEDVMYVGSEQTLTFENRGGRINSFYGILMFAIFENNTLQIFNTSSGTTILLCTGGTVLVDSFAKTALFASNSNPIVISEFCNAVPSFTGISYTFEITENDDFQRFLTVQKRNTTTTPATVEETTTIQVVTGLYVTSVSAAESITYINNEIVTQDSAGNTVRRIVEVDQLFVNTDSSPFRSFEDVAPIPFTGPGTLTYSRNTAFFTTDPLLGEELSFKSRTAPIPDIDFERVPIELNTIDGVDYNVSTVIVIVGGDRVITFEATSYSTSTDQEILYSGSQVTVTRPIRTGGGSVTYNGVTRMVTYTDTSRNTQTIAGVNTFYDYSGGDITTTTTPDTTSIAGPGKLYVSADSANVLFRSSDLVTSEVASIIRQGVTYFSVGADQFSSSYNRVFNVSTNSSIVTYPGGGVIWSSTFNGSRESFYIEDAGVSNRILRDIGVIFALTKSDPAKDQGLIRAIFNGRVIYSYTPITTNRDILIREGIFFAFNGTAITGPPDGPFTGIDRIITHNGIEVKEFNSDDAPVRFVGYGLLLVQSESDTAFFTTSVPTINYLLQSIKNLEEYLIPPEIEVPSRRQVTTKLRAYTAQFGTNVKAYAGADITFVCEIARGRPQPVVEFSMILEDGNITLLDDSDVDITIVNNSLTLSSIGIDDSGEYKCRAENIVPPVAEVTSTLKVKEAVAPLVRPGWFPFEIQNKQRIFWPSDPPVNESFEVQVVRELVIPCRVDGRPKANVLWQFNGLDIQTALGSSANITEVKQGRSVLTIDVEANQGILSGVNVIECSAANAGGATSGRLTLHGVYYNCTFIGVGECSITCGIGLWEVMYTCVREESGMPPQTVETNTVPEEALSLGRTQICPNRDTAGNVIVCPHTEYRWSVSEWTECTRTCGGGSRNRSVTCLNISIPLDSNYTAQLNSTIETEVNDSMCRMSVSAGAKPISRELCNTEICPVWRAEEFSECSVTCGTGVQARQVTCINITGYYTDELGKLMFNITELPDSLCDEDDQPMPTKECRLPRCFYGWLPAQFGACGDVPLPDEFPFCRQRGFFCYNGDPNPDITDRIIDDSFCADLQPSASSLGSCNGGRCFNGIWEYFVWTPCSATCGYGMRTRDVQCRSPITLTVVPNDFCDVATMPPPRERCFVRNCKNKCLRDESILCPILQLADMCDSPLAMGENGLRCCDTCLGLAEDEEDSYF